MGWPSLISGQKLLTGHRCWGRFSCVFHYSSTPILVVECSGVPGEDARAALRTYIRPRDGRRDEGLYIYYILYAAAAGALQENRQYFCRAKNGGGGGSKTMWTPPLPSPLLPLPHPAGPASSTRSDGAFLLVGRPDGYARATPPRRWHPLHVARRHRAIPAQGLLMFLGRRVYMHTYIIRSGGGGGVYAPNTCYILLWRFSENGLFEFFIRHPFLLTLLHTPAPTTS